MITQTANGWSIRHHEVVDSFTVDRQLAAFVESFGKFHKRMGGITANARICQSLFATAHEVRSSNGESYHGVFPWIRGTVG